jgi:hypothetical protein
MSGRRLERALARLARGDAVLRLDGAGPGYGVFTKRDRRRRALLRLSAGEVRGMKSEGVIEMRGDGDIVLSEAGAARVAREAAKPGEAFIAQHGTVVTRSVIDADGEIRETRGLDLEGPMRRLAALRGPGGELWLSQAELDAAAKLRADWAVGEIGLVRGSDWMAAPMGSVLAVTESRKKTYVNAPVAERARTVARCRHRSEASSVTKSMVSNQKPVFRSWTAGTRATVAGRIAS